MEIPETVISTECVNEADVKHFVKVIQSTELLSNSK